MKILPQLERWNDEKYGELAGWVAATSAQLWDRAAEGAVQALLHLHEHNFDTSKPQRVYVLFVDHGQAEIAKAIKALNTRCSGITGMGKEGDWKHNKGILESSDKNGWEEVLASIKTGKDLRALLVSDAKEKQKDKAPTIQLPKGTPEEIVNAAKFALDVILNEPNAAELLQKAKALQIGTVQPSPLDKIPMPEVRERMNGFIDAVVAECEFGKAEAINGIERSEDMILTHVNVLKKRFEKVNEELNAA